MKKNETRKPRQESYFAGTRAGSTVPQPRVPWTPEELRRLEEMVQRLQAVKALDWR